MAVTWLALRVRWCTRICRALLCVGSLVLVTCGQGHTLADVLTQCQDRLRNALSSNPIDEPAALIALADLSQAYSATDSWASATQFYTSMLQKEPGGQLRERLQADWARAHLASSGSLSSSRSEPLLAELTETVAARVPRPMFAVQVLSVTPAGMLPKDSDFPGIVLVPQKNASFKPPQVSLPNMSQQSPLAPNEVIVARKGFMVTVPLFPGASATPAGILPRDSDLPRIVLVPQREAFLKPTQASLPSMSQQSPLAPNEVIVAGKDFVVTVQPSLGAAEFDGTGALLSVHEKLCQFWQEKGVQVREDEQIPFYLFVLSESCPKDRILSVQQELLKAWLVANKDVPESYEGLLRTSLKTAHPANRGWIALSIAEAAYKAGHKKIVPALIEAATKESIDDAARRSLQLLTALSRFAEGEHEQARKDLQAWLEKYPEQEGSEKVRFLMGWSYLLSGDNKKASEWFELVIKLHPDTEYAKRAKAFISRLGSDGEDQEKQ